MQKTENTPKTIVNEAEIAEKVEKIDTEGGDQETNNVQKTKECNYDEIKVIQENMVTVEEKVETRF